MRRILILILIISCVLGNGFACAEYCAVNYTGGSAVIDENGNIIFSDSGFDHIYVLTDDQGNLTGYAAGIEGNDYSIKYALLSAEADILTDFSYTHISSAGDGFIAACRDRWQYLDINGAPVGEVYSDMHYIGEGEFFVIAGDPYDMISDVLGKFYPDGTMIDTGLRIQYGLGEFAEGLMPVFDGATGYYGYVDRDGKWAIEPVYKYAGAFKEGLAVVASEGGYGLIDTEGKNVVIPIYDFMTRSENMICATKDDLAIAIDFSGNIIYEVPMDGASVEVSGEYMIITDALQTQVIDANGAVAFCLPSDCTVRAVDSIFIIRQGEWSTGMAYLADESGLRISAYYDTLALLDDSGDFIFSYGRRDSAGTIYYGLLGAEGVELTECEYSELACALPGLYIAVRDAQAAILDAEGNEKGILTH